MRDSRNPPTVAGLTRRQYAQILAGASALSIAGCLGDDGNGDDSDDGSGDDESGDSDDDSGDSDDGEPDQERQRDALRYHVNNIPSQANMNIWAPTDRTVGQLEMTEFTCPRDFVSKEKLPNGHTWEASWIDEFDEISVPTVIDDWDVEPPHDMYEYIRGHDGQDPLTYWDGEPITAETYLKSWQVDWHNGDNHLSESATFNYEMEDEFVFHRWTDKGEAPEQSADERNEAWLEFEVAGTHQFANMMHPKFTTEYAERYLDADTEDDTVAVHEDLESDRISYQRYAEDGLGSGLYEIDPETISQAGLTMNMRDDHPNEHAAIPQIDIRFAEASRWATLAQNGDLDLGEDIVLEEDGVINRQSLPDHVQELDQYIDPASGDHWAMNWHNPHLERLWVRRAIIAAIDWFDFGANGWGAENSIPNEYFTTVPDGVALTWMDEEFLESLHQYPIEQDLDTAEDWLRRAGYEGDRDSGWTGPEGRDLVLTIDDNAGIADWAGANATAESHLGQVGIEAEVDSIESAVWSQRHGQGDPSDVTHTMGVMWVPGGEIWNWYNANGQDWTYPLVGGDPGSDFAGDVDYEDIEPGDRDNLNRPFFQEVPTEAGAFDAPDEAGASFDPPMESEQINLAEYCLNLSEPGWSSEEIQERIEALARYANYYLPFHNFHSFPFGLWGNVRDFTWPETGHPVLRGEKEFAADEYQYLAGIPQGKFDDDYPDP